MQNNYTILVICRFCPMQAATVLHQGNLDDLVDPRLKGVYSVPAYEKMLEIAVACTKQYSHERPTMSEVMDELDEAWALALANSPQRRAPEVANLGSKF